MIGGSLWSTVAGEFLLQAVAPVALVGWLVLVPPKDRFTLSIQVLSTSTFLWAVFLLGTWLLPPAWVRGLLVLVFAAACAAAMRDWNRKLRFPARWIHVVRSGICLVLLGVAVSWINAGTSARLPPGNVVNLTSPFDHPGARVVHGGFGSVINPHRLAYAPDPAFNPEWRGVGFAADVVVTNRLGIRRRLFSSELTDHFSFDEPVLAPCAGNVLAVQDHLPDRPPGKPDNSAPAGNFVVIECGGHHVALAHFKAGSIVVTPGAPVRDGDLIARIGNSGGTLEPHLHLHVQTPGVEGRLFGGEPVPFSIDGKLAVRGAGL